MLLHKQERFIVPVVGTLEFHYIWSCQCLFCSKVAHMIQWLLVQNAPAATGNSFQKG